jgi:hypothetical protein
MGVVIALSEESVSFVMGFNDLVASIMGKKSSYPWTNRR